MTAFAAEVQPGVEDADGLAGWRREFVRAARAFCLIPEILPERQRDGVAVLYCLCRRLDDAVDGAPSAAHARAALDSVRAQLAGTARPGPLVAAFLDSAIRHGLPLQCLEALLDGMAADLEAVRIATDGELLRYSYRVSAAVGLMLAPLLGAHGREAEARVVDLGIALQISNVLLGVRDDARLGRVYLPATRLSLARLSADHVLRAPEDGRLLPVLRGLAALADAYYDSVEQGASLIPLRYRHGVLLLARTYRDLGWLAARGEIAPKTPAQLPLGVLARHLAGLALVALRPRVLGLLPPATHDPSLHQALAGFPGANAPGP
jgi:phytoene synthase